MLDDETLEGPEISAMIGIPDARFRAVFLRVEWKRPFIELIEFDRPKGRPLTGQESVTDVGNAHFSFVVEDIHQAKEELEQLGIQFAGPPLYADEGTFKGEWAAYCYDPDGKVVELWSLLSEYA